MANLPMLVEEEQWYSQVPRSVRKQVTFGLLLMLLSFGGFALWAFRAPLAAAVIAQGSFVATGQNKIIQHLEGGIIENIMVNEGDTVVKGQVLLRLDQTTAAASERELFLRKMRLEATEARLLAQYNHQSGLVFPDMLIKERANYEVGSILDGQLLAFQVAEAALEEDLALLQRNFDALEIRRVGYETQLDSYQRQHALLLEELEIKQSLLEEGLIRRSEYSALERKSIDTEGQVGRLQAEVDEIETIKLKYNQQMDQEVARYRQTALDNLQVVQSELDGVREQARAALSVKQRKDVVAPVSGTVVRLHYHTSGGVIETGRPILEILPADQPLIVEVQISRADIDDLKKGQTATVRLTALNQRTTPVLEGEVIYISADAVTDRSTGVAQEVYVARISLHPDELRRVTNFRPTPGMPAEIMIQTAERTFAQYLAKPIIDSMTRAFREQ